MKIMNDDTRPIYGMLVNIWALSTCKFLYINSQYVEVGKPEIYDQNKHFIS